MGMKQYKNRVDWRAVALATRDMPVLSLEGDLVFLRSGMN
jgi:hypothetical protein